MATWRGVEEDTPARRARNAWVWANEDVHRAINQGKPTNEIQLLMIRRDTLGDRWEQLEIAAKQAREAKE